MMNTQRSNSEKSNLNEEGKKIGINEVIIMLFRILKESNKKPNKIWIDNASKFYNSSVKKWLEDNNIEMYSIYNEGKSVAAERFIRTLKTKIYKYMTSLSKKSVY